MTIGLFITIAEQYQANPSIFSIFHLAAFLPLPIAATIAVYAIRKNKDVSKAGRYCAGLFVIMNVTVFAYAAFTKDVYRLSHNVGDAGEALGIMVLLFLIGFFFSWFVGGRVVKLLILRLVSKPNLQSNY